MALSYWMQKIIDLEKNGGTGSGSANLNLYKRKWNITTAQDGSDDNPATIILPEDITYEAGKNQIMLLAYNGSVCIIGDNYEESDDNTIKVKFPVEVGDLFEITIVKTSE